MCGVMLHWVVLHYSVQLFVRCSACFLAPACDWNLIIFWYLHDCWYMIEECNKNEKPCCIGHKGCASHTHTHTHTLLWPSRHIKMQRSLEKETLSCFFGSLNYWYCTMKEYSSCLSAIWSLYWLQYIDSNFFTREEDFNGYFQEPHFSSY